MLRHVHIGKDGINSLTIRRTEVHDESRGKTLLRVRSHHATEVVPIDILAIPPAKSSWRRMAVRTKAISGRPRCPKATGMWVRTSTYTPDHVDNSAKSSATGRVVHASLLTTYSHMVQGAPRP
jgi:hypothetical protein